MDPMAFSIAVMGFLFIMGAIVLPRFRKRRRSPTPRPAPGGFVPTPDEEARLNEARDRLINLENFANRSFARLDTRVRLLNRLIEDADVRIRQLEEGNHGA